MRVEHLFIWRGDRGRTGRKKELPSFFILYFKHPHLPCKSPPWLLGSGALFPKILLFLRRNPAKNVIWFRIQMFVEPKSTPSPPKELWGFQTFFSNEIWESLLLRAGINFRMRIQARPGCAVTSAVTLHQEHIPCKWLPAGIRFIPKSTDVFSAGLGS